MARAGCPEACCGEHYSSGAEPISSPPILLGTVFARTRQITLWPDVVRLPQYHAAVVAGQCAMFDRLSGAGCRGRRKLAGARQEWPVGRPPPGRFPIARRGFCGQQGGRPAAWPAIRRRP